jgi:hypothetical protein
MLARVSCDASLAFVVPNATPGAHRHIWTTERMPPTERVPERVMDVAQCEVCGNEYEKALGTPDRHVPVMLTVSLVG